MAKQRVKQLNSAGIAAGWVPTADGSNGVDWAAQAGGGSGVATKSTITESGIAVANVVLQDGVNAQADSAANAEAVGVVESVSGSDAIVVTNGFITLASGVWPESAGATDVLFLSEETAGLLTKIVPSNPGEIEKPMVVCASTTTGYVVTMRGQVVSANNTANLISSLTKAGIAVGQPVLADGTAAQADNSDNAEAVGVVQSVDGTTGAVITGGEITLASGTWPDGATLGDVLYVDPDNAGALVKVAPTTNGNIDKPMVVCQSTTTGIVVNMRGVVVTTLSLAQAPLFHVRQEEADGVSAGASTATTWVTRVLNTIKTNEIVGASLNSNQITLPAGDYELHARAPATIIEGHQIRVQNITAVATIEIGTSEWAPGTGAGDQNASSLVVRFSLSATSVLELQHITNLTSAIGLGQPNGSASVIEVYGSVLIWKIG